MQKQHRELYTSVTGNTIGYDTYTFGAGEKKMYIQGGVHGGEVTYFIFEQLAAFLQENEPLLTGEVCLAPLINPRAWEQRIYYYTAGKFDWYKGKDWNRSYRSEAKNDLSSRTSETIFSLAAQYAFCIDLHTARTSSPYTIYTSATCAADVSILGLPYAIFAENASPYTGSFLDACHAQSIPAIAIECGSHDTHNNKDIDEVVDGIVQLLKARVYTSHTPPQPTPRVQACSNIQTLFASESGFIEYLVAPRTTVAEGAPLYRCVSSTDITKSTTVYAPESCIVLECAKTHIALVGDELIRYIRTNELTALDTK